MKLSDGEKLILMMLCEIYKHQKIKGEIDRKLVQEAVHTGNVWGLKWAYPGIFDIHETEDRVRNEVLDFLEMWDSIEFGHSKLTKAEKSRVESEVAPFGTRFKGFDGNNEADCISVARFLIDHLDRYEKFKGRDLNSHVPSLDVYRRMYIAYAPIQKTLGGSQSLSADRIIKVFKAAAHPTA